MSVQSSSEASASTSLRTMLAAAYKADPCEDLFAPAGDRSCRTLFNLMPEALAVLRVAAQMEPNPVALIDWYRHTRIRNLGDLTAEQLVAVGRAEGVIYFLAEAQDSDRG